MIDEISINTIVRKENQMKYQRKIVGKKKLFFFFPPNNNSMINLSLEYKSYFQLSYLNYIFKIVIQLLNIYFRHWTPEYTSKLHFWMQNTSNSAGHFVPYKRVRSPDMSAYLFQK